MAIHVPRPLNERMGLTVSTLTMTGTPSRPDRPSWTYWGASRKTGGSWAWAARMAAGVRSSLGITAGGAPDWVQGPGRTKTPEGTTGP